MRMSKVKILITAVAAVMSVSFLLSACESGPKSPYPEVDLGGNFVIADDNAPDIFEDEEYLALDRNLYVKKGGLEYAAHETDEDLDEGARFFFGYFDAIAKGDAETYNTMFSEKYYESYLPQEDFTQQMIYDMHIEIISRSENGENLELVYYVDYKIHRNNGTFRQDILHDASRKLCFTLSGTADNLLIDSITY